MSILGVFLSLPLFSPPPLLSTSEPNKRKRGSKWGDRLCRCSRNSSKWVLPTVGLSNWCFWAFLLEIHCFLLLNFRNTACFYFDCASVFGEGKRLAMVSTACLYKFWRLTLLRLYKIGFLWKTHPSYRQHAELCKVGAVLIEVKCGIIFKHHSNMFWCIYFWC